MVPTDLGSRSEQRCAAVPEGSLGPMHRPRVGALHREQLSVAHHVLCPTRIAGSPNFGPPRHAARGAKNHIPPRGWVGSVCWRDAQADVPSARRLRAQLAFKNSMVRGILQFTPSIAFRYVLHRCESRDIRCRESFRVLSLPRHGSHVAARADTANGAGWQRDVLFSSYFPIPWRDSRRGFVVRPRAT